MSTIDDIRRAVRLILFESVQPHSIVAMEVLSGKHAEYESYLRVYGFDKAMSREATGFGAEGDEDVGAWKIIGLPGLSATGMSNPPPWISFVDWLWGFLRESNLNPMAYKGFGDLKVPYGQLKPHGKRVRKYGESVTHQKMTGMKFRGVLSKIAEYAPGYDIKRDVTFVISSLGNDQDEATKKWNELMKDATTPGWFKIMPGHDNNWFISVNVEIDEPDGWRDRATIIAKHKEENRDRWKATMQELAAGRTSYIHLASLVGECLAMKHGFPYPFNVDLMEPTDLTRAIDIVKTLSLDDIVTYAKERGKAPPVIGKQQQQKQIDLSPIKLTSMWDAAVGRIAVEGDVDELPVQVALSDYMVKNAGFSEPFDVELLSPTELTKASTIASSLHYDDISNMIESVQRRIKNITR
jgi:hypothetical protein